MLDILNDFYKSISLIDLAFLIITTLSVIKCYRKGFILSLLAASKWLLAYVVTLVLFSRIKPYFKNIIDSEYVLDILLGIMIFVLVIFVGFIRGYVVCVCLFSAIDIVYNYNKWPINVDKSYTFPYLEKGSNYLVNEFPNEETYQDSKEKIEDI